MQYKCHYSYDIKTVGVIFKAYQNFTEKLLSQFHFSKTKTHKPDFHSIALCSNPLICDKFPNDKVHPAQFSCPKNIRPSAFEQDSLTTNQFH